MKAPIISAASVLCPHCRADLFPGRMSSRNRRVFAKRLERRAYQLLSVAALIEPSKTKGERP